MLGVHVETDDLEVVVPDPNPAPSLGRNEPCQLLQLLVENDHAADATELRTGVSLRIRRVDRPMAFRRLAEPGHVSSIRTPYRDGAAPLGFPDVDGSPRILGPGSHSEDRLPILTD